MDSAAGITSQMLLLLSHTEQAEEQIDDKLHNSHRDLRVHIILPTEKMLPRACGFCHGTATTGCIFQCMSLQPSCTHGGLQIFLLQITPILNKVQ